MGTLNTRYMYAGLWVLLALPAGEVYAARPSEGTVVFTGWLQVNDLNMKDVVVEFIVNGTGRRVSVSENGRFSVQLPPDTEGVLRFDKPGHQRKELIVDTRHVAAGGSFRRRHVKFGVILELERYMGGLGFTGPVGAMTFTPNEGALHVEHTRNMMQREKIMEF